MRRPFSFSGESTMSLAPSPKLYMGLVISAILEWSKSITERGATSVIRANGSRSSLISMKTESMFNISMRMRSLNWLPWLRLAKVAGWTTTLVGLQQ